VFADAKVSGADTKLKRQIWPMYVDPHEIGSEFVPWVAEVPAEAAVAAAGAAGSTSSRSRL